MKKCKSEWCNNKVKNDDDYCDKCEKIMLDTQTENYEKTQDECWNFWWR